MVKSRVTRVSGTAAAAAVATCGLLVLGCVRLTGRGGSRTALSPVPGRFARAVRLQQQRLSAVRQLQLVQQQALATRQEEEEAGALNGWNSKGSMYIKNMGGFAEGTHGMNLGGAALSPSSPGGLGYPPPAATSSDFTPIDNEMQGDCVCDQPWEDSDHVVLQEIVCHCPRYMVPQPMAFPGNPPPPTELEYDDGCRCVVSDDDKGTTCTCPIRQVDVWDYAAHPPQEDR